MGKKATSTLVVLCIASLVLLGTPAVKAQVPPFSSQLPASVHILADGSIDPPTAAVSRAGDVYTLTGDVGINIVVDRDNVTIDGAGYTLWGNFTGRVNLDYRLGVTVKNLVIKEAGYAFAMYKAADNTFVGNSLINCSKGFSFFVSWRNNITRNTFMNVGEAFDIVGYSTGTSQHNVIVGNVFQNCGTAIDLSQPNNVFSDNIVTGCYDLGVSLSADYTTFHNNTISNNGINFEITSFNNDVDELNTINGKPIVYWVGHHDETVPSNTNYVVLVNCNNIQAHDLEVEGIDLASTSNSFITGNRIIRSDHGIQPYKSNYLPYEDTRDSTDFGIQLVGCSNDVVSGNSISGKACGFKLADCTGISVVGNNVTGNTYCGLKLTNCTGTSIFGNNFASNAYFGMMLSNSNSNVVEGNTIASNGFVSGTYSQGDVFGVSISDSSNNRFVGNTVKDNNFWGIRVLGTQQGNVFYHNNFVNNQVRDNSLQVSMLGLYPNSPANPSIWDNGKEGNYWSDYRTRYPNASEVDGSGVGDTPFYINVNNQDNYPLMAPFDISVYVQQSPSPSPTTSPVGSSSPSPSQSASTSPTPQSSSSPKTSPSTSQLPAGSPELGAGSVVFWELVLVAAMVAVVVAVVLVLVFGLRRRK